MRAGFPHSEICGSAPICRLPAAYRRLSRPSSPIIAKASTTCTYSLDPITLPPLARPREPKSLTHAVIGNSRACASTSRDVNTMQYITQCSSTRAVITTTLPTNNYLLSQIVKEPTEVEMVGLDGFEPSTPALSRRCSNQLSYRPAWVACF